MSTEEKKDPKIAAIELVRKYRQGGNLLNHAKTFAHMEVNKALVESQVVHRDEAGKVLSIDYDPYWQAVKDEINSVATQ